MDIDPLTANEFLVGPDLLIAPPPIIEQTVAYAVQLPSAGWYDYWTGKRVEGKTVVSAAAGVQPESGVVSQVTAVTVTPQLAELPVYVRPGTILPYAPLTGSTRQQPSGALTLRVFLARIVVARFIWMMVTPSLTGRGRFCECSFPVKRGPTAGLLCDWERTKAAIRRGGRNCTLKSMAWEQITSRFT